MSFNPFCEKPKKLDSIFMDWKELAPKSYDKNEVDMMLMNLSTNYFKVNNSYYQEGQYLTKQEYIALGGSSTIGDMPFNLFSRKYVRC